MIWKNVITIASHLVYDSICVNSYIIFYGKYQSLNKVVKDCPFWGKDDNLLVDRSNTTGLISRFQDARNLILTIEEEIL